MRNELRRTYPAGSTVRTRTRKDNHNSDAKSDESSQYLDNFEGRSSHPWWLRY